MKLTKTKRKILDHIGQGMKQKDIADKLGISESAVSRHIQQLEFCSFIRLSARSSFKAWELHPDYLKYKRKKVNFVSASASHELTKNDIQVNQLVEKRLTSKEAIDSGSQPTSPNPLREPERSSLHHLFIPIPLSEPKELVMDYDQTNELNNVYEHYKEIDDKMTLNFYESISSGRIVSTMLKVKLTDFNPNADPRPQVQAIFEQSKVKGLEYLRSLGLNPDVDKVSVSDIHIARMDEISIEDGKVLNKQRLYLPRMREKLTPNDPDQQAYIEFDKTPGPADNEETNDTEHDHRRFMMAENIHDLKEHLMQQTSIMDNLSVNIATHLKVLTDMKDTMAAIRELAREKHRREVSRGYVIRREAKEKEAVSKDDVARIIAGRPP